MRKKLFTLLLAVAASVGAMFAWDYERVQIGDLYYNLDTSRKLAWVTYKSRTERYIGMMSYSYTYNKDWQICDANIPASVSYGGITYAVIAIEDYAFNSCQSLTSVTIPNSVTSIGTKVFGGCGKLNSIVVDENNTVFDSRDNCNAIIRTASNTLSCGCSKTVFPNSVTSIGDFAFYRCSSLTSVTIPNSVTSIGEYAFCSCTSLTSVTIGNGVTRIDPHTFYDSGLLSIEWNAKHCSDFNYYKMDANNPFYEVRSKITSFVIGEEVEYIPAYLCYDMYNVPEIIIPNCKTKVEVGTSAFYGCKKVVWNKLVNVSMTQKDEYDTPYSGSIEFKLSDYAGNSYYTLNGEKNVSLQNLAAGEYKLVIYGDICDDSIVTTLQINKLGMKVNGQFYLLDEKSHEATLTYRGSSCYDYSGEYSGNIIIPKTITFEGEEYNVVGINGSTFEGCNSINSITMESEKPISISNIGLSNSCIIYVPYGSLNAYKANSNWNNYNLHVLNPSHATTTTAATSAKITLGNTDEAKHISSCGMEGGEQEFAGNVIEHIGLEPNSEYADIPLFIKTKEGDIDNTTVSFTTSALELTTKPSKPVSATIAILLAETNMADIETSCGFEWKRNDMPDDYVGNKVFCPVANGSMAGRLKNLKDDVLYKYRAFYQSAAGNMYYGDWQYIFTGDVAVEFDPILYTYAAALIKEHEATLKGYALAGSTDFTEQGFEYWAESRAPLPNAPRRLKSALGERHTVTATGISMRVSLSDLDPGTTYRYRTYAKIGDQILYGSEMTFTTQGEFTYAIKFVNWDGEELQTLHVAENAVPEYTGETPVRPDDEQFTYTFSGWTPEITAATADATYTATFKATEINPEALDQITNDQSTTAAKIFRDGQLYIIRGENVYTVDGQQVK